MDPVTKPTSSPGGSGSGTSQPKKLSKNTSALRFMQRGAEVSLVDVGHERLAQHEHANANAEGGTGTATSKRRIVVTDSITYFDAEASEGRFSAQGFNAEVEKRARAESRAVEKVEKKRRASELEEARKGQVEIPDEEMAKRLRAFTRQPTSGDDDEDPGAVSRVCGGVGVTCAVCESARNAVLCNVCSCDLMPFR